MRVLIVTKGHPFEAEPFFAVFDEMAIDGNSLEWDHVEHPDALVMYEMPAESPRPLTARRCDKVGAALRCHVRADADMAPARDPR